jgi:hypothetical protein
MRYCFLERIMIRPDQTELRLRPADPISFRSISPEATGRSTHEHRVVNTRWRKLSIRSKISEHALDCLLRLFPEPPTP